MSDGFDWFPDWSREPAIVVGGGPSARDANLEIARGRAKVLAINEGYRLCPWADVLYAADSAWWSLHRGAKEFRGLRVSQSDEAQKRYGGIRLVKLTRTSRMIREPKGTIGAGSDDRGSGANSGFQAWNLAYQFGARRIILVGFDLTARHGYHWHGRHPDGMNNPTEPGLARWGRVMDSNAAYFRSKGIEIVNASPASALQNYAKTTLEQALDRYK